MTLTDYFKIKYLIIKYGNTEFSKEETITLINWIDGLILNEHTTKSNT